MGRVGRALVLVELLAAIGAGPAAAQGVTTAALYGVIRGPDSTGIADAVVTLTNSADGGRWRTSTRADGRYVFEYASPHPRSRSYHSPCQRRREVLPRQRQHRVPVAESGRRTPSLRQGDKTKRR